MASQKSETGEAETTSKDETGASGPMRSGVCKWFNVLKGWGFITPEDGGQEVFVHQSVIHMGGFRSLGEGERVEFQSRETERGQEATVVTGPSHSDCKGSSVRPLGKKKYRRIRCFNCGQFGNHVAAKCRLGQLPKSCYQCKSADHLIADCPHRKEKADEGEASLVKGARSLALESSENVGQEGGKKGETNNHAVGSTADKATEEKRKPIEERKS